MKRPYKFWTEEEDEFIKKNQPLMKIEEMANALGRTKSSVSSRLGRLGCRYFRQVYKDWNKIKPIYIQRRSEGKTHRGIAEELGFHPRTLTRLLTRAGFNERIKRIVSDAEQFSFSLSEGEKCYLAGFIDGDGSISLTKTKSHHTFYYTPVVHLSNTSREIMEYVARTLKINLNLNTIQKTSKSKPLYKIVVSGYKRTRALLSEITSYLHGKRERAELMLEFCEKRLKTLSTMGRESIAPYTKEERRLAEKIRRINKLEGH